MGTPASTRLSGSELRQLLQWRRRLRDEIVRLPRAWQLRVLSAIEGARRRRLAGPPAARFPLEMGRAELIRWLKWRIDAAGVEESAAGIRALDRARRARAARTAASRRGAAER
jgi:hypothetical protein